MRERQCPTQEGGCGGPWIFAGRGRPAYRGSGEEGHLLTLPTKTSRNLRMVLCAIEELRLAGPQSELDLKVEEG